MREILADLVAEQQALDQSLQRAPDRDWRQRVARGGVTVADTIAILAWGEQHSASLLVGETTMEELLATYGDLATFEKAGVAEAKGRRPQEVIEWWRFARADVVDALSRMGPSDRVPWVGKTIAARTFATIRLADTWAHGLGVLSALSKEIIDAARLRHVAWLGWATLPNAFAAAGEQYSPIKVDLSGPQYSRWVSGPADASEVIRGPGGDWCRLVVGFTSSPGELAATGEVAATALRVAGIYR
ncbi:MAG: maleylpyruvate isomerase family mycothiol-dependent enzyme [Acidimicrobiia bacterium]|nr:MAG: maleylpyruvate isomerase family mycothiol-dependent enzyme [Acidimicrobiia bacterium]